MNTYAFGFSLPFMQPLCIISVFDSKRRLWVMKWSFKPVWYPKSWSFIYSNWSLLIDHYFTYHVKRSFLGPQPKSSGFQPRVETVNCRPVLWITLTQSLKGRFYTHCYSWRTPLKLFVYSVTYTFTKHLENNNDSLSSLSLCRVKQVGDVSWFQFVSVKREGRSEQTWNERVS